MEIPEAERYAPRILPINVVAKIMRSGLHPKIKIGKQAKNLVQDAAMEFLYFISAEAGDRAS